MNPTVASHRTRWWNRERRILDDSEEMVGRFHDPSPGAMVRVVLAPCSPFSVSTDLMRESAELARDLGVRLHTHLAETRDEEEYCLDRFGLRPVDYAESVGWLGEDVWFAHAVHLSTPDTSKLAHSRTGVSHCPTSNMRLASGIAPLARFIELGVPVGLGVDGAASNDGSDLLAEARQALLVSRVARAVETSDRPMTTARQVLRAATRGGAEVLGRDDIGVIEPGRAADAAIFSVDDVAMAGVSDPLAALVFCAPQRVDFVRSRPSGRRRWSDRGLGPAASPRASSLPCPLARRVTLRPIRQHGTMGRRPASFNPCRRARSRRCPAAPPS